MKINHRIAEVKGAPFWEKVRNLGLQFDDGEISVLNITEDHEAWPIIEILLTEHHQATHFVDNIYDEKELSEAEWLSVFAKGHHGYPQPDDDFGYKTVTYDTTNYCPTCGIGLTQKAPFRLRAEPKAKRSHFLQLNWVFDELFIRPEVRNELHGSSI